MAAFDTGVHGMCSRRYDERGTLLAEVAQENVQMRELLQLVLFHDEHTGLLPGSIVLDIRAVLAIPTLSISDDDAETD